MRTQQERREIIFSIMDEIATGVVDEISRKLGAEDEIQLAVTEWNVIISELALRFEEGLRKNIPAARRKAIEVEVIKIHPK